MAKGNQEKTVCKPGLYPVNKASCQEYKRRNFSTRSCFFSTAPLTRTEQEPTYPMKIHYC